MIRIFILFFVFALSSHFSAQKGGELSIYKGNQNFEKKDFDAASYHYLKAAEQNQNDFKAQYNLGNALYKKNQYEEAIAMYQKALQSAKNEEDKKSVLYNLGNAHYKNNQKKQATDSYKKALKIAPRDEKILKNLRIAQQKDEQKNQQSPQEQSSSSQNQPENQQKNDSQNGKEKSPMDMYAPENDKFRKEPKSDDNQQNNPKTPQKEQPQDPREQELIQYLEEKEKHTARKALNKQGYAQPQSNKKDW